MQNTAPFPNHRRMDLAIGNRRAFLRATGLAATLGAVLSAGCDAQRTAQPAPGASLQIELPTLDGTRVRSVDWRGKTVVLNVWASWCGPCRAEMASLEALSRAADPTRLLVIGVTVDEDRNLAREYLLRERISFPILSDVAQDVVKRALGVHALPTTLVVGPDGVPRARVAGAKNWIDPALLESLSLPPRRGAALVPAHSQSTGQLPRT
jgi:thiol-disulfide isomerase/thioredoxin